ncbi:hypothetical protein [uncultured Polaribacter sp.]|uniref:hypothetical protein n=1 Tax=uncultured Polaribacter sp. TaxID=174711 RepID=UPI00263694AC|nr:hypothetical protein [uncultured Polaribacter sp.]
MARAMFEYTITVLQKVSFNSELFCRELDKAIKRLLPYEVSELRIWLQKFTENKPDLMVCMNIIK